MPVARRPEQKWNHCHLPPMRPTSAAKTDATSRSVAPSATALEAAVAAFSFTSAAAASAAISSGVLTMRIRRKKSAASTISASGRAASIWARTFGITRS